MQAMLWNSDNHLLANIFTACSVYLPIFAIWHFHFAKDGLPPLANANAQNLLWNRDIELNALFTVWSPSYTYLIYSDGEANNDEDEVPCVNQKGGGGGGAHVGAAVGKTEYTIFCL